MRQESRRLSLREVARITGATLTGDAERTVHSVAPLRSAGSTDVSLFDGNEDAAALARTRAAAVLVRLDFGGAPADLALLRTPAPHQAFLALARDLWQREHFLPASIDPSASVHPDAHLGDAVHIGAGCQVGAGASLRRGAVLHPGASVASGAIVGEDTVLHSHVFVGSGVRIGASCILHPGAVIGFAHRPTPRSAGALTKPPSTGIVVVEDDVEIGPNSVVERGEQDETRICRGAKLGALVVVGHDSVVGPRAELVAMVGLAGGVEVGADALLLGQVGVSSRGRIGERSVVFAKSGVAGRVPPDSQYAGIIARPRRDWLRAQAALRRLPRQLERLEELERKLEARSEAIGEEQGDAR